MTASSTPTGFKVVRHPSGTIRPLLVSNFIPSGYATNLFKGTVVSTSSTSGQANVTVPTSGNISYLIDGFRWVAANGTPQISNQWPGGTTTMTGTTIDAEVYSLDSGVELEVQADGAIPQAALFDQANPVNAGSGSTITGLSTAALSSSLAGGSASAMFTIINIAPYPGNAWGDSYTIVRVKANKLQQGPLGVTAL